MENTSTAKDIDVSLITPVHNSEAWLKECLESCAEAINFCGDVLTVEISIYLDACTDRSSEIIREFRDRSGCNIVISEGQIQKGVGGAKNMAIKQSNGKYICIMDSDDYMRPERILLLYEFGKTFHDESRPVLIGSKFTRIPEGSMHRFTKWANEMNETELNIQIYTSNTPTIVAPTWFCSRKTFDTIGFFKETEPSGFPEDLDWFYRFINQNGLVKRVDKPLLFYRYHKHCATLTVKEGTIWDMRVEQLESRIIPFWNEKFSVWNAGKQGRKFYWSLTSENQSKIKSFCDVDPKKLAQKYYVPYDYETRTTHRKIPIICHTQVTTPVIICVKLDWTNGEFEENLRVKNWIEGKDYILFS